jgi:hypothetical protein
MEDGCSKRFDIGTMDLRAENASTLPPSKRLHPGKASSAARSPTGTRAVAMPAMSVGTGITVEAEELAQPEPSWANPR